jgi:protein translocase SecG subunit
MTENFLRITHLVVTVLMIGLILLQNRSANSGNFLSGSGETFRARRGLEKIILWVTVGLAVVFVGLTIWLLKV